MSTIAHIDADALTGLAGELRRQMETKRDLVSDTRRTSFVDVDAGWAHGDGDGTEVKRGMSLNIDMPGGAELFAVTPHAHNQIATHLDLGRKTYERLLGKHPELFVHLVNGLLSKEPSKRMLRTMDGKVRAFLSNKYRPRDNWDLLDGAILPELQQYRGRVVFKQCSLTETRMYVKIVFPEIEKPVTPKVGDVIRGGVIIQNSEVGAGSLGIYPYTDRRICTNGMVHTDLGQRSRHVGKRIESNEEAWELYSDDTLRLDDAAFFAKCRDTLRSVMNEQVFDVIVQQMQDLAEIRIPGSPVDAVEVLAKKHTFTDGEKGSILEALVEGSDLSAWGYVNAITQTARDLEDADRQVDLEVLAGKLTADNSWALAAAA